MRRPVMCPATDPAPSAYEHRRVLVRVASPPPGHPEQPQECKTLQNKAIMIKPITQFNSSLSAPIKPRLRANSFEGPQLHAAPNSTR
jgi:hypothetical protein